MRTLFCVLVFAFVLVLFGVVGSMDYQDELEYNKYACEMVEMGAWPKHFCQ